MGYTKMDKDVENISALDARPNAINGLTAEELKETFDAAGKDLKAYLNETLIPELDEAKRTQDAFNEQAAEAIECRETLLVTLSTSGAASSTVAEIVGAHNQRRQVILTYSGALLPLFSVGAGRVSFREIVPDESGAANDNVAQLTATGITGENGDTWTVTTEQIGAESISYSGKVGTTTVTTLIAALQALSRVELLDKSAEYGESGAATIQGWACGGDYSYDVVAGSYVVNGNVVRIWDTENVRNVLIFDGYDLRCYQSNAPHGNLYETASVESESGVILLDGIEWALVPKMSAADAGKVLTVNRYGDWSADEGATNAVQYTAQEKTETEKAQARENIDALGGNDAEEVEIVHESSAVASREDDANLITAAAAKTLSRYDAVYGTTTFAQIEAAFNAKIPVFVRLDVTDPNTSVTSNVEFRLQRRQDVNASVSFFHFYAEYSELGYFVNLRNNNTWSAVTLRRYIGAIDEDNPSVFNYPSEKAVVDYVAKKLGGGT